VTGFHTIETWNSWWAVFNAQALAFWERQLDRDDALPMIGGSDMHQHRSYGAPERPLEPGRIGFPTTWVHVDGELTPDAILAAVREGRTFVSESPSGPQLFDHSDRNAIRLHVAQAAGMALLLSGPRGVVAAKAIGRDDIEIEFPIRDLVPSLNGTAWVRPEIHAVGGAVKALGQAIRV
jgi:hypothetical protein